MEIENFVDSKSFCRSSRADVSIRRHDRTYWDPSDTIAVKGKYPDHKAWPQICAFETNPW
jgi:hypothetical protein